MWGWLGELFKAFGSRKDSQRLDFEAVTVRWENMYDKATKRQDDMQVSMESLKKEHDTCRLELLKVHERAAESTRKLHRVEDKLTAAIERIAELENKP